MDARRHLVLALDLARVADFPAATLADIQLEQTGQIEHSPLWHEQATQCERPYCREEVRTTYYIRNMDRLRQPGKDIGVAPLVEATRAWVDRLARTHRYVPLDVLVDCSGGDYAPMFRKALEGTHARFTAVEMTATGPEPSHSFGPRWLRISRTRLLTNLQLRLEQQQIRMPREAYELIRGELFAMRRVVSESRQVSFQAGQHDDLVVSLAIATWMDLDAGRVAHAPGTVVWG